MDRTVHRIASSAARIAGAGRRFAGECRGMAAIEMAFVFPFMVIIYFGLVDITNILTASRRVTLATSTLADLVTQAPGTVSKADLNGFYNAVEPIMDPFPADSVKIDIIDFRVNNSSVVQQWSDSQNGSCGDEPSTEGLEELMTDGNDLVMARVCVDYVAITGKVFGAGPFTLHEEMVLRPRQALQLDCSDC
jgi:Flp pilus assembly protein TadG